MGPVVGVVPYKYPRSDSWQISWEFPEMKHCRTCGYLRACSKEEELCRECKEEWEKGGGTRQMWRCKVCHVCASDERSAEAVFGKVWDAGAEKSVFSDKCKYCERNGKQWETSAPTPPWNTPVWQKKKKVWVVDEPKFQQGRAQFELLEEGDRQAVVEKFTSGDQVYVVSGERLWRCCGYQGEAMVECPQGTDVLLGDWEWLGKLKLGEVVEEWEELKKVEGC